MSCRQESVSENLLTMHFLNGKALFETDFCCPIYMDACDLPIPIRKERKPQKCEIKLWVSDVERIYRITRVMWLWVWGWGEGGAPPVHTSL